MNERIRQLSEQCGFRSNPDIYDRNQSFDIEKFAELIVRECIDVIGEDNYTMLTGKAYCTELKRHFGVKE